MDSLVKFGYKFPSIICTYCQAPNGGYAWQWEIIRPGKRSAFSYRENSETSGYTTSESAMQAANRWIKKNDDRPSNLAA